MSIATLHETVSEQALSSTPDRSKPQNDIAPPAQRRMRWSHEDYHKLIDAGVLEGKRVELWDGEIVQVAPQSGGHYSGVYFTLRAMQAATPESHEVLQQLPCILDPDTEREPDLVVIEGTWQENPEFPTSPVLAIEVSLSTLREDRHEKASLYARNNIQTYWIVNCVDRVLEVRSDPVEDANAPFGWRYGSEVVVAETESVSLSYVEDRHVRVGNLLPLPSAKSDRADTSSSAAEPNGPESPRPAKETDK